MKIYLENKEDDVEIDVSYMKVSAYVRNWESCVINGIKDEDGKDVPFKRGDMWEPTIDLEKGLILNWNKGDTGRFHIKVVDSGTYWLLDSNMNEVANRYDNYVPDGLCHGDRGYGDYIIFNVNLDGYIENYRCDISEEDWELTGNE